MVQFLTTPAARAVLLLTATLILVAIGVYFLGRFRGRDEDDQPASSEALTNFRELHARGDLSDAEYRTIKTVLAAKLQEELNDRVDEG